MVQVIASHVRSKEPVSVAELLEQSPQEQEDFTPSTPNSQPQRIDEDEGSQAEEAGENEEDTEKQESASL